MTRKKEVKGDRALGHAVVCWDRAVVEVDGLDGARMVVPRVLYHISNWEERDDREGHTDLCFNRIDSLAVGAVCLYPRTVARQLAALASKVSGRRVFAMPREWLPTPGEAHGMPADVRGAREACTERHGSRCFSPSERKACQTHSGEVTEKTVRVKGLTEADA